jgi:SulP family sulfate permease
MKASVSSARAAVFAYFQHDLAPDLAAGLTGATAGVPQAMGFAIVAGISPVYGVYTAIVSTIVASVFGSTGLMTTGPTNALAVVVGSTLAPFSESGDLLTRVVTLTFLVGLIQAGMGLLRLGGLTRYVSTAVMTGFVTGAALLVALGQLTHLTRISTEGQHGIVPQLAELFTHLDTLHPQTFVIGIAAIVLIVTLHRTRLSAFATLIAIIVTGLVVFFLGWDVPVVRDTSAIPNGIPAITYPKPGLVGDLLTAALATAVLGLVQTAALAESIKDTDENSADASREFVVQGLGNLLGAVFQSMPAGGSLSRTAVNIKAGARTRGANIFAGLFVAAIMLLFGSLAERIALAALAGHLIVAAVSLIPPERINFVWRASWTGRWAMVATCVSTFVLPLQYSVYVGVVLSLVLYIYQSSHMRIVHLEPVGTNIFREAPLPEKLPDGQPVLLSVQGPLYFAAMRDLQTHLPDPNSAQHPVVILRLRGDTMLAGTGAALLVAYAEQLRKRGGKLVLCGVENQVIETLTRTGALARIGEENVFLANEYLLASTQQAVLYARQWLDEQTQQSSL